MIPRWKTSLAPPVWLWERKVGLQFCLSIHLFFT